MMTVRREPTFDVSPQDISAPLPSAYHAPQGSGLSRWVNVIQLVGALVAVPVGLGSAYSLYRTNFVPESACEGLRASIVAMLDKNVDAGARRVLMRRDVETFERTCATVDPEATKAFKELLMVEKKAPALAAAPPPAAPPKLERSVTPVKEVAPKEVAPKEVAPKEVARKPEARSQQVGKQAAPAPAEPARPEVSDTQWIDAVRQAMAKHHEQAPAEAPKALGTLPPPVARPAPEATATTAVPAPAPAPVSLAPPLTQAPPVAETPRVREVPATLPATEARRVDPDHPVPPGAIPDATELAAAKPAEPRSRLGRWISRVPLLGPVWENGQH
jgi:hypothetical protein